MGEGKLGEADFSFHHGRMVDVFFWRPISMADLYA